MHAYRTHNCGELRLADAGTTVRLSGWIHRKRDHGNLLFIDLRDHYGITQCVVDTSSALFPKIESVRGGERRSTLTGRLVPRTAETIIRSLRPARSSCASRPISSRRGRDAPAPGQ